MSDLTNFGVDVQGPDEDDEGEDDGEGSGPRRNYPNGRCPAISITTQKRCRGDASQMNDADGFCAVHARKHNPWTIHDDPETLIVLTGQLDALSLGDVDPDAVDFDVGLVQRACAVARRDPDA